MSARDQGCQRRLRCLGIALLGLALPQAARAEVLYHYTDFGGARPTSINAQGDVVLTGGYKGVYHSYGANAGQVSGPEAYGLNADDSIQGITDSGGVWGRRADYDTTFSARNHQVTDFGREDGIVVGANASGQIAAMKSDPPDGPHPAVTYFRTWIEHEGQRTDLGFLAQDGRRNTVATAINNAGQVTGGSSPGTFTGEIAFLYKDGQITGLGTLGGQSSTGNALNDHGHVVGFSSIAGDSGPLHAFLAKDGQMTDLGTLTGHTNSTAVGINDSDQVVGTSSNGPDPRAFLWESGTMKDLNALIAADTGLTLTRAVGINDAGQIIGVAMGADGFERGFLLTPVGMAAPPPPVPEPGTWAFFGTLAIGLAVRARRRA